MAARIDVITIQVRFGVDTPLGLYQDTLYFTEKEWSTVPAKDIEAQKQALADTWVTFRSAQIADEEAMRTKEGQQAKLAEIDGKISDLTAAKAALEATINGQ